MEERSNDMGEARRKKLAGYEALPEPTLAGYDLRQVMCEMADAATSFFRDKAKVAVVLKVDLTQSIVIFAADRNAEAKLRQLLTIRDTRPVPLGLPVGFLAWVRGRSDEESAAAIRVDAQQSQPNTLIVCTESKQGKGTWWFAAIPVAEYADEKEPAAFIGHVLATAGPEMFFDRPVRSDEINLVRHPPFRWPTKAA